MVSSPSTFDVLSRCKDALLDWSVHDDGGRPLAAGWRVSDTSVVQHDILETTVSYHIAGSVRVSKFEDGRCRFSGIRNREIGVTAPGSCAWAFTGTVHFAHIYLWPDAGPTGRLDDTQLSASSTIGSVSDPWLSGLFAMLLSEINLGKARPGDLLSSLNCLVVDHLNSRYCVSDRPSRKLPTTLTDRAMQKLNAFVGSNLCERIGLAEMADALGYSPAHFLRAFRGTTGTTPYQHVLGLRLEEAKTLLLSTNLSIEDIARGLRFNGSSHFSCAFRKKVGATPTQFRELGRAHRR